MQCLDAVLYYMSDYAAESAMSITVQSDARVEYVGESMQEV